MKIIRTCEKCLATQEITTSMKTNMVCQQCGHPRFALNKNVIARCEECGHSFNIIANEYYDALHSCINDKGKINSFFLTLYAGESEFYQPAETNYIDYEAKFKIAIPYYNGGVRIERALKTWLIPEVVFFLTDPYIIPPGNNICTQITSSFSSKDLVGSRTLPVFPDILRKLMLHYPDEDYYGVINSDIILPYGMPASNLLPSNDKFISIHHRADLKGTDVDKIRDMKNVGSIVVGKDAFFFTRWEARKICGRFPDMIMGFPFWDTALATYLVDKYGEDKIDFCYGEIHHVYHKSGSEAKKDYDQPEGKYNHKKGMKIFKKGEVDKIWPRIVKSTNSERDKIKRKAIGIIQPGRLGDIIICLPIAKYYYDKGYEIFWPIPSNYMSYFDYAPYVKPIPLPNKDNCYEKSFTALRQLKREDIEIIDLAIGFGSNEADWRQSGLTFDAWKYREAKVPFSEKYNLKIQRDIKKEKEVFSLVIGADDPLDGYVVIHDESSFSSYAFSNIPEFIRVAPLKKYTLFDWLLVFEQARYLIMVDSAALNLVNQLGIGLDKRYYVTWHHIREKDEADRLTPHLSKGWMKYCPIKYKGKEYPEYINDNNAASHILNTATKYCKGQGVDLGGGKNPFPGAKNMDAIIGDDIVDGQIVYKDLDYIFSSHFLEHIEDYKSVLKSCYKALKEDGILFLYLPHPMMEYWHPDNPAMQGPLGHKKILVPEAIKKCLEEIGFNVIKYSNEPDHYYSYYIVAKKYARYAIKKRKTKKVLVKQFPKVAFLTIAYEAMPFLEHAIKQVANFASQIILVEGAIDVLGRKYSRDGTVEFMTRGIYDIVNEGMPVSSIYAPDLDKKEMQNRGLRSISRFADYLWLIDYDEIWPSEYIEKILYLLKGDEDIAQVNFRVRNFFRGYDRIIDGGKRYIKKSSNIPRIFKLQSGNLLSTKFVSHRPPRLEGIAKGKILTGQMTEAQTGTSMQHFSYVSPKQIRQKIELYQKIYQWKDHLLLENWYHNFFLPYTPEEEENLLRDKEYGAWVGDKKSRTLEYNGILPESLPPKNEIR